MSSANRDSFIFYSLNSFYFSSLTAVARTSKTMLYEWQNILVLFLILEEMLNFSPLRMMLAVHFL